VGHGCRNHRDAGNAQKARKAGHYNGVKMGLKPGATKEEGRDPDPIGVNGRRALQTEGSSKLRGGEGHDVSCPYIGRSKDAEKRHSGEWRSRAGDGSGSV